MRQTDALDLGDEDAAHLTDFREVGPRSLDLQELRGDGRAAGAPGFHWENHSV